MPLGQTSFCTGSLETCQSATAAAVAAAAVNFTINILHANDLSGDAVLKYNLHYRDPVLAIWEPIREPVLATAVLLL